jgi:hypothetical protein
MEGKDHSELVQDQKVAEDILKNLKNFKSQSELRRTALNIFVKMCQPAQYDQLSEAFKRIDTDCSGFIDETELRRLLVDLDF